MTTVPEHLAESIFSAEQFSNRFEKACNALLGAQEGGVHIYSTSASWDLGRDGKAHLPTGGILANCCTLKSELDDKARSDLARLARTRLKVQRLYYCSSQRLSELAQERVEGELWDMLPDADSIVVYGRQQLAELATRYPDSFLRFYRQDLADTLEALKGIDRSASPESDTLNLALSTIVHERSDQVRTELFDGSIRLVLADRCPRNAAECARDVSNSFRLARMIPKESISHHLLRLETAGHIERVGDRYTITDDGLSATAAQERVAKTELLEGRQFVREALEAALGDRLADPHYNRIWKLIQETIAEAFFSRGRQMVAFVSRLLGDVSAATPLEAPDFIRELAQAVASTTSSPEQRTELEVAMRDLFEEPLSRANRWLVQLCTSFVALCSLGLEEGTGRAIARLLSRSSLVLDTDVALSLLGIGEVHHESVEAIVNRWRALGGEVLVSREVLHELGYHAQIAAFHYDQVESWLPGTAQDRFRLIQNAFVRSFAEHMALGEANRRQWPSFIEQYRDHGTTFGRKIAAIIKGDYGIGNLSIGSEDEELRLKVVSHLEKEAEMRSGGASVAAVEKAKDKARRDASLYALLVARNSEARASDPDRGYLLVSSSKRLSEVEDKFQELGEKDFVITVGMALYLVSLVPEVSLGIGALRAFLFDGPPTAFSSGLEMLLLRVIKESPSYQLPWAKRTSLTRKIRQLLLERARSSVSTESVSVDQLEQEILQGENLTTAASLLKEALDSMPANRPLEQEVAGLRQEVASLQAELKQQDRSSRSQRPPSTLKVSKPKT
jgi:hypothetical protein